MQPQAPYEKEDAENIIRDYLNGWVEWRNDGLFIQQGMVENDPTGSVFHWTPAYNMEWDGAPDPTTAPSLPFPFTANQLAAFMLNGIGTGVAAAYGTWEHGPDEAAMDEAMGIRARRAREALRKAFFLYREAEKIVGELAPEVWSECLPIHPSILRAQGKKLALQATLKHLSWCRAMTRQLLQPQATTPSTAPEPQATPVATVGASDGVVTDKAGPGWSLKTSIKRTPGYRWPLYEALRAAHIAGQPCPKAQHFLDTWKLKPPTRLEVIQLPTRDELEYELETGIKKRVTVKQIQAAIKGLLSK